MNEESSKRHHRFVLSASLVYLAGVSGLMLRHNVWFSPDQFFIFALFGAIVLGRGKKFIADWAPFILVFLSYEFLRGAVPAIANFPLHSTDLIAFEKSLFGFIPTLELQKYFLDITHFRWYDFYLSLVYMSYFIFPLIFGFFIWSKNRQLFRFLTIAVMILMYAGFVTYVLFPAMPPWMASEKGLLPHVNRVLYMTTAYLTVPGSFPTIYSFFGSNTTAAMPSLHAALPTLLFLISFLQKRRWLTLVAAIYALSMYFAIIYLGEHYVIDGVVGIIYAILAFPLAKLVANRFKLLELGTDTKGLSAT